MNSDPAEDLLVGELPEEIGEAASDGDFERVKAWLAGGSAYDPPSVNDRDDDDWTLLHWTAASPSPFHVEFARYLLSRGARVNASAKRWDGSTALHFACGSIGRDEATAAISMLVAAGATVNTRDIAGRTPLFRIYHFSESTIDVVTVLLRAGASLDFKHRIGEDQPVPRSFEAHLDGLEDGLEDGLDDDELEHVGPIRNLVASVRAAGSWKAHCRLPHKQILRLRSLVARGRTKERLATTRAIRFIVRQGDNGIVWNILSYWRETG